MQNWLEEGVAQVNMEAAELPEVQAPAKFFDENNSEVVTSVVGPQKQQLLSVLVHNSPFLPKDIEQGARAFTATINRDNRRIAKSVSLVPVDKEDPEMTVQLSTRTEYPDGLMIDAKSEALCSDEGDVYMQRIERFNSEGKIMGEMRRLRIPVDMAPLPPSLERFSSHLQIDAMIGFGKDGYEKPALGITIGGYSDLNNDAPLIFYGSNIKADGTYQLTVFDESPMVEKDQNLAAYLKRVVTKYGPLITQKSLSLE